MDSFRDFVRVEGEGDRALPAEKIVHILRPPRSGRGSYGGLRTLCGLGRRHRVWRISLEGARVNVGGEGWAVCAACCLRAKGGRPELRAASAPFVRAYLCHGYAVPAGGKCPECRAPVPL